MNSSRYIFLSFGQQCKQTTTKTQIVRCLSTNLTLNKPKTGIMMLNMGGPKTASEVPNYLLRIMTDTDMIQLPVQSKLGPWIAKRRAPEVAKKYEEIGGGSPILRWTDLQGELLCRSLDKVSPSTAPHKHYVAFRYANPLTEDTLQQIEKDGVNRVVIFSQYPQYSCATTGSSFNAIYSHYKKKSLPAGVKWSIIDRWSTHPLLAKAIASRVQDELAKFSADVRDNVLVLFSAHSLPLKAVNRGDSYPSEVGATVQTVMRELAFCNPYALVWQSKVGPLPWLEPSTEDALKGYAKQGRKHFILVPVAFVNEHIETLHEMDIEYCGDLGAELGLGDGIRRAAAPNDHPLFISALTDIVTSHLAADTPVGPKFLTRCAHCVNPRCASAKAWFKELCYAK